MPKFRKKPVVIEAVQLTEALLADKNLTTAPPWLVAAYRTGTVRFFQVWMGPHAEIDTKNGTVRVQPGEWILQGVAGEIYPCDNVIFEQTYEPEDTPPSVDTATAFYIKAQARIAAADAWKIGRPVMDEREQEHPEWFQGRFDQWANYQARLRGEQYVAAMRRVFSEAFYREVVTLALAHEAATEAVE